MLVKIANTLINPVDLDGEVLPTNISAEERKARMGKGEFDVAGNAKNFIE